MVSNSNSIMIWVIGYALSTLQESKTNRQPFFLFDRIGCNKPEKDLPTGKSFYNFETLKHIQSEVMYLYECYHQAILRFSDLGQFVASKMFNSFVPLFIAQTTLCF